MLCLTADYGNRTVRGLWASSRPPWSRVHPGEQNTTDFGCACGCLSGGRGGNDATGAVVSAPGAGSLGESRRATAERSSGGIRIATDVVDAAPLALGGGGCPGAAVRGGHAPERGANLEARWERSGSHRAGRASEGMSGGHSERALSAETKGHRPGGRAARRRTSREPARAPRRPRPYFPSFASAFAAAAASRALRSAAICSSVFTSSRKAISPPSPRRWRLLMIRV
jgi:hypothetical protein